MSSVHTLHKKIGDLLKKAFPENPPVLDAACDEDQHQHIPLFVSNKSRENQYCKVDALFLNKKKDRVRIIIEIEETERNPIKLFGKLFASNFSRYYIPKESDPIEMDDNMLFIQIVRCYDVPTDTMGKTSPEKLQQFKNVRDSIKMTIQNEKFRFRQYEMITGDLKDFDTLTCKNNQDMKSYIEKAFK